MSRQAIAYSVIFLMILGLIAAVALARYHSRDRAIQRRKARERADRERTAAWRREVGRGG